MLRMHLLPYLCKKTTFYYLGNAVQTLYLKIVYQKIQAIKPAFFALFDVIIWCICLYTTLTLYLSILYW